MTLTNDVTVPSPVVILTSADVTLDTDGRDCSFKVAQLLFTIFIINCLG